MEGWVRSCLVSVEMWKAVATGAASLVVGFVLLQLQRGGFRKRLRNEIKDEFEILKLMEDGDLKTRLDTRVKRQLRRYVDASAPLGMRRGERVVTFLALLVVLLVVVLLLPDDQIQWAVYVAGVGLGAIPAVLEEVVSRRRKANALMAGGAGTGTGTGAA